MIFYSDFSTNMYTTGFMWYANIVKHGPTLIKVII